MRVKGMVIGAAFMLVACGSAPAASLNNGSATPSPAASSLEPSPAAAASPTPQPSPSPTASAAPALPCRLPIDRGNGAFLTIPASPVGAAVFESSDDPSSQVKLPDGEPRMGLTYDWQASKWLPVPHQLMSPDGTQYVYTDSQSRVHLVGVASGTDSVIESGAIWGLYGFTSKGIYAGQRDPSKVPSLLGLWLINPTGGAPQKLAAGGTWLAIGSDAAWSVVQDGADASVPEGSLGLVLTRLDLATLQQATWYTSTDGRFRVAALDSGGRPVLDNIDTATISLVVSQASAQTVMSSASLPLDLMADAHGIWVTQPMVSSIYLWQGGGDVQRWGQYGYGGTMQFAGSCA